MSGMMKSKLATLTSAIAENLMTQTEINAAIIHTLYQFEGRTFHHWYGKLYNTVCYSRRQNVWNEYTLTQMNEELEYSFC